MFKSDKVFLTKTLVGGSFLVMIGANFLANALPINDITTGEISALFPNLFTPAGFAFGIWGLIYLFLAVHTLFQLGILKDKKASIKAEVKQKAAVLFSVTCFLNAAWIYAWHYLMIPLSLLFMICLLVCLYFIVDLLKFKNLSNFEKIVVRLPFSIYFGWISVATIANVTIMLVDFSWNGFSLAESFWTVLILLIATSIGITVVFKSKDIAYGLVFVWAYIGILVQHTSSTGFAGQFLIVIVTVIICSLVLIGAIVQTKLKAMKKQDVRARG